MALGGAKEESPETEQTEGWARQGRILWLDGEIDGKYVKNKF